MEKLMIIEGILIKYKSKVISEDKALEEIQNILNKESEFWNNVSIYR